MNMIAKGIAYILIWLLAATAIAVAGTGDDLDAVWAEAKAGIEKPECIQEYGELRCLEYVCNLLRFRHDICKSTFDGAELTFARKCTTKTSKCPLRDTMMIGVKCTCQGVNGVLEPGMAE